jgi:4-aminobutyrate aminotransferase/(S)-3-amino-2-methylpropionate transaminase
MNALTQTAHEANNLHSDLLRRREAAVPRGVSTATPIFAARALNAELWDENDRRYIDFSAGIGTLNTGHRHPKVMAAVAQQMECYTHTAFQVVAYRPYIELAERLNARAPFSGPAKTIFFSTGAEAVENAVKIARAATGRSGVIAFSGGFHGRTTLTMALTGKVAPYKRSFVPSMPNIYHVPFPVEHRGTTLDHSLRALTGIFSSDIDPTQLAAIIIEPVQGEGGFHVASPELLLSLRRICDEHGIVLIADEVQSGFGRTGRLFAIEHSGVEPDLITMAKSIAGGFPLSGVMGRKALMDAVEPGGLGGTYAGSPVALAAALAVLDVLEQEALLTRAHPIGDRIRRRAKAWMARTDLQPIANVRGLGAMVAFDVVSDRTSLVPDGASAKALTSRALANGLIVLSCGTQGETIRFLVPLTASDAIIDEGLDCLEQAMRSSVA